MPARICAQHVRQLDLGARVAPALELVAEPDRVPLAVRATRSENVVSPSARRIGRICPVAGSSCLTHGRSFSSETRLMATDRNEITLGTQRHCPSLRLADRLACCRVAEVLMNANRVEPHRAFVPAPSRTAPNSPRCRTPRPETRNTARRHRPRSATFRRRRRVRAKDLRHAPGDPLDAVRVQAHSIVSHWCVVGGEPGSQSPSCRREQPKRNRVAGNSEERGSRTCARVCRDDRRQPGRRPRRISLSSKWGTSRALRVASPPARIGRCARSDDEAQVRAPASASVFALEGLTPCDDSG